MAATTSLAGGMREAVSCNVCLEVYDRGLRTPLVLPCGHSFCRPCLVAIRASQQPFLCPSCRAQHNVQVEALAVNYSLLNIASLSDDFGHEECKTHGDNLRFWCSTCGLPLCSLCLHSSHPQGHSIKLTAAFVQEEKLKLVEKMKTISSTYEKQKAGLREDFNNLDAWMKELFRREGNLQTIAADLYDLLAKIQKAKDIASIEYLDKAVRDFRPTPSGDEAPTGIMKDSREEAAETVTLGTLLSQPQKFSIPSQQKHQTTQVRGAGMDFHDGRLLLHSLAEPRSTRLSLQMPSEVFLELSVGDRRLGYVYISLWSHMRLAQQFLALCMGTMGPSLIGIKALEKMRGIIVFRFDAGGNSNPIFRKAQTIRSTLLTSLEWGGPHAKPEADGCVMRIDGNNGMAFGICTQRHLNSMLSAPFGTVVAGLDVARNAFQHDPVTEVTVSHCGLVLPGLSLVPKDLPRSLRSRSKKSRRKPTDPNCQTQ